MRYALVLLLGLAIGALAMNQVGKVLAARDAYPRGVMAVMQQHFGALSRSLDQGQCRAMANRSNLAWVSRMSTLIGPALDPGRDPRFQSYAQKLDARLAIASAVAPGNCPALRTAVDQVGQACSACHVVFR